MTHAWLWSTFQMHVFLQVGNGSSFLCQVWYYCLKLFSRTVGCFVETYMYYSMYFCITCITDLQHTHFITNHSIIKIASSIVFAQFNLWDELCKIRRFWGDPQNKPKPPKITHAQPDSCMIQAQAGFTGWNHWHLLRIIVLCINGAFVLLALFYLSFFVLCYIHFLATSHPSISLYWWWQLALLFVLWPQLTK